MDRDPARDVEATSGGPAAGAGAPTDPGAPGGVPGLLPSLSLPKGGGAIRSIGEKFAANPVTGTGSMSVPLATSPGRSGFGPQLSLSYDSGAGNGPFGFGWSLSIPRIRRKTDKGLPRYRDAEESDVFLLSGAEDLVPVFERDDNGDWVRDARGHLVFDEETLDGYTIRRYRPRIEGLFARIERWTRRTDGDVHWRSISRDNVLTLYGKDERSRIADPEDPGRIFTWLICETRDDRGNAVVYDYKPEDGEGVDLTRAHERNRGARDDLRRTANRYLKHVRYGNRRPLLDETGHRPRFLGDEQIDSAGWMFEVVFDYGEHHGEAPKPEDPGPWRFREDPFSTYRAGFEVRTCRLCKRVLTFHHFADEPDIGNDCLARSTDLTYSHQEAHDSARDPIYAFLREVTQSGYQRAGDGYLERSLPPVEFEYAEPSVQDEVEEVDVESLENLPAGVDGAVWRWADLHGEGLPGILTEQAGAWFYKRNLSPASARAVELAPQELVAAKPNLTLAGGAQLMDLAGDGRPDVVVLDGPAPGFYEHDGEEGWQPFRLFASRLERDMSDPNLRFVDLDGDGHADVLISEDEVFVWHSSLAEEGFGAARRVRQAIDEEDGPRLVFAESTQSIHLADLSGDGLTDLVRIRNGEVCYWPNLGYGRFGAKVTMDPAPHFDRPDHFEPRRLRLADVDGTGTTDILYLHGDGVRLYFNQSGNSWSAPRVLSVFPSVDDLAGIAAVDLLGNGTACLVWSSPLPGDRRRPMRYVDLMGGRKPHLLVKTVNNLGAETEVEYAPSTKFYLEDRRDGRPWITRLPFPVHVVERVETRDRVSGNRFVTRYAYHHGYFDGDEREFRGFGMVEQWDTEEFAALTGDGTLPATSNLDAASHVPPALTRTWFHTGVYAGRHRISNYFAGLVDERDRGEYYREPAWRDDDREARKRLLPDTVLPAGLTAAEEREACRALKGSMLRREVYALDGTEKEEHPYTVTEQNFTLRRLQPHDKNRHAVFFTHPREAVTTHYERNPDDPRIQHALTLEVDGFGNVLKELAIAYGRRTASVDPLLTDDDRARQTALLITYTENRFTREAPFPPPPPAADHHRTPLPAETRTWELTGFQPEDGVRFSLDECVRDDFALLDSAEEIPYEQTADGSTRQKRRIEHVRTLYRRDDLSALLPFREVGPLAVPGESYKLAFTPGLLRGVFVRPLDRIPADSEPPSERLLTDREVAAVLGSAGPDGGGYVDLDGDGHWWISSGRVFLDPGADVADPAATAAAELETARGHFYLPRKLADPFGHGTMVYYDAHDLLAVRTRDALGNTVTVANDYRVLQPWLVTDPNRNRTGAEFDALGLVVATAVMGKADETDPSAMGDLLGDFDADLPLVDVQAFAADPRARAPSLLGRATTRVVYDLDRYRRSGQPPFAATLARETHFHDPGGETPRIQVSFSYSDGFGREIQKKVQAEAGDAPVREPPAPLPSGDVRPGDLVRDASGELVYSAVERRWVGTGRTVFNNKGEPVRQYEPFFSATHLHEPEREMTDTGVSPVLFYDPAGRAVATLHPNHTYEKVVFDPWRQTTWDVNDTVAPSGTETGDPRTDPDVGGYVRKYFESRPATWRTWYTQRIGNEMGADERVAAQKAAAHAGTPAVVHLDVLGRPFLTIVDNGPDAEESGRHLRFATRVELDVEGNPLAVRDAIEQAGDPEGRIVLRYRYDVLGNRIHQASMEAGERWSLSDAAGNPIRAWDSRGFSRRTTYDELRRPTALYVSENGSERLAERTVYGDSQGDVGNHRTRVYRLFDGAGVLTSVAYDFKGNLLESRRELLPAPAYRQPVSWDLDPAVGGDSFTRSVTFDALDRPVTATSPDGSVERVVFNEANLLERVEVNLRGADVATTFVTGVEYDARGQRTRIAYGNGAVTRYEHDPLTFRLHRLRTTRPPASNGPAAQVFSDPAVVQDLSYTYDPVGNLTRIEDAALRTVFHGGRRVEPVAGYTYDALYRLIEAEGREHVGQTAFEFRPPDGNHRDFPFVGHAHPNDLQALRHYTERYRYDAVGNFETMRHVAAGGGWTKRYVYDEDSLLEAGKKSNRLSRTVVGNGRDSVEPYAHDVHGNMTSMPHLAAMAWDFEDQLQQVDLGGGGTAYYVYDAAGERVRKVVESRSGTVQKERIYLGGFEIYREFDGDGDGGPLLERETLHVMDDQSRIALVETRTVRDADPVSRPDPLERYQLGNHLGSASVELDGSGALISYEEYHPYGTTAFQAGRTGAEVKSKRYRYTGKERDEATGFSYHGARYYAPWLGRWSGADPALWRLFDTGPETRLNLRLLSNPFVGMANNPVAFVDLDGEQDTAYTRYLDRQFATVEGTRQVLDSNRAMGEAALRVLAQPQVAGTLQTAGGVLELVGAGALLLAPEPTMATKASGVALGAHGVDTLQAGIRTLATGEITHTVTHDATAAAAGVLGASEEASQLAGVGADVLMSVGPAVAGAISRSGVAAATQSVSQSTDDVAGTLFRGTSEGFPGSPGLQRVGVTPTSEDPLVSTIFATESQNYGRGVVQVATPANLEGVALREGNVLASLEREIAVELLPLEFAERAGIQITAAEARSILERMGHVLPSQIQGPAGVSQTLGTTARLTEEEIRLFVQEARLIAGAQ